MAFAIPKLPFACATLGSTDLTALSPSAPVSALATECATPEFVDATLDFLVSTVPPRLARTTVSEKEHVTMASASAKPLGLELTAQRCCVSLPVDPWENAARESATAERVTAAERALSLDAPTDAMVEEHVSTEHASATVTSQVLTAVSSDAHSDAASMEGVWRTTLASVTKDGLVGPATWLFALETAALWVCATTASAIAPREDRVLTARSRHAPTSAPVMECAREECASVQWDGMEMTAAHASAQTNAPTMASACTAFFASAARDGKVRIAACPHARRCAHTTASATRGFVPATLVSTELIARSSTAPTTARAMASAAMAHAHASLDGRTLTVERPSTSRLSTVL